MDISVIFRENISSYIQQFGRKIPFNHLKVINAIINCRTASMGGEVYYCQECKTYHYSYHSCQNRHCPKCGSGESEKWLEKQMKKLLPVKYHMVTFTLPEELRFVCRSNQRLFYSIIYKASSEALKTLLSDPKYAGGYSGFVGVLHTWTRKLQYHLHIHYIVPGGAFDIERNCWNKASSKFLIPVKALSPIFRAKFRDILKVKSPELYNSIPKSIWYEKGFNTDSRPFGKGENALKYLANYVYRIAITNNRIIRYENGMVTFQYKESKTDKIKYQTVTALEFMRRFLQHVLPSGFQKVRYYGFMSSAKKVIFERVKQVLGSSEIQKTVVSFKPLRAVDMCPKCAAKMLLVSVCHRKKRAPPFFWKQNLTQKQTLIA
jgi:hypothetical protein